MTHGVVFHATGAQFVAEAVAAAKSLAAVHSELPMTLFADRAPAWDGFERVLPLDPQEPPRYNRFQALRQSPYVETLLLDSDTYICPPARGSGQEASLPNARERQHPASPNGSILDLFPLLQRFDLALAAAPTRLREAELAVLGEQMCCIPLTFPQPNSGVILYRRSAATDELWQSWERLFRRDLELAHAAAYHDPRLGGVGDQAALREALYTASLSWATLPPEYNCVLSLPGQLHGPVHILHARHPDPARVAALLNQDMDVRAFALDTLGDLVVIGRDGRVRRSATLPAPERRRRQLRQYKRRLSSLASRLSSLVSRLSPLTSAAGGGSK